MSEIRVSNLVKSFGAANVIDNVSFTVEPGQILVLLGASGCGKTTTLRCIAGLERPTSGSISIDGKTVVDDKVNVPPEHRRLGMVFQSYALWPHKTVAQNIAYGLGKMSANETAARVKESLSLVGLDGMQGRLPSTLSGGQQQRVALARSAAPKPKVILLDEPLSNLDAKLRDQMRTELRRLIKGLGMTAIYITHDQSEAMALADKVIFMKDGHILQEASPREIYRRPATKAVAAFIGNATFLEGTIAGAESGHTLIDLGAFRLLSGGANSSAGSPVTMAIRPEVITLSAAPTGAVNETKGRVVDLVFLGESTEYTVEIGTMKLLARSHLDFDPGTEVHVSIEPDDIVPLPKS
jgi:iron(III) transport system ATP-binding protein